MRAPSCVNLMILKWNFICDFDTTILFSTYKYIGRSTQQKIAGNFFVIKPKWNLSGIIVNSHFDILRRTSQKQNFTQISIDLGQIELLRDLRTFPNWAQFKNSLCDTYSIAFNEKCSWQYLEFELGNNTFYVWGNIMTLIKGCVRFIFASLFYMSKREHFWNKEKYFLFHFESSSRSWDNQLLTF